MGDNTYNELPPVGQGVKNPQLAALCNWAVQQSVNVRQPFIDTMDASVNQYLYGREAGQDDTKSTMNLTQGTVDAFVSLTLKTPPVVSLEPSCVGDTPVWMALEEIPGLDPTQPIPRELLADIPEELRVGVDAKLRAEFYQTIFDAVSERSEALDFYRENVWLNKIAGYVYALFQWDPQRERGVFSNIPAQQWYPDPTTSKISEFVSLGLDWPMDVERAKRYWPDLAAQFDKYASKTLQMPANNGGYSAVYQISFQLPIVTIRFVWLRNQEAPMETHEAIGSGMVHAGEVPDLSMNGGNSPQNMPQLDAGAGSVDADNMEEAQNGNANSDGISPGGTDDAQEPPAQAGAGGLQSGVPISVPPAPAMRSALLHPDTGEELTPEHAAWPRKYVNRLVMMLQDEVVKDEVDPYWDIPVLQNINTPIPFRPFGLSDPTRYRSEQADLNTVHGSIVSHAKWFKGPTNIIPMSMAEVIPSDMLKNFGMQPGKTYTVEDHVIAATAGRPIISIEPPALPAHMMLVKSDLKASFDSVSGYGRALQGDLGDVSGQSAAYQQNAATATAEFRTMQLTAMIRRSAHLLLHAIIHWMPTESLLKINRKYPAWVVDFIRAQTIADGEMDITVNIGSDAGATKAQKEASVRADFAAGIIDLETACDLLGYDFDKINQRRINQQMAQPAVGGAMNPPGQPGGSFNGSVNAPQPAEGLRPARQL